MKSIRVVDLVGENCVTGAAGDKLFGELSLIVSQGRVELNFAGCRVFASPFFNASLGRLVGSVGAEKLRSNLAIEGLSAVGADLLSSVIENSREYYARADEKRRAYDEVMTSAPSDR